MSCSPRKRRRHRRRDESGSALVMALFFAVVFSLFVGEVVSFTAAGLKLSTSLEGQRTRSYDEAGAVDGAINAYARAGGSCAPYPAPPTNGQAVGVTVQCQQLAPRPAGTSSKPGQALLALGTDPAEGVVTHSDLRVRGDVVSRSTVTAATPGGVLRVEGTVSALRPCSGDIRTVPATGLQCGPGADPVRSADPDYSADLTTIPRRQALDPAALCAASWLVTVPPGYYDDATPFSTLTGGGACAGKVVWFPPGAYYFDFGFRGVPTTSLWTVNDPTVTVVGGTPKGWSPEAPSAPSPPLVVPGSCAAEGDPQQSPTAANDGVQLIFGGESHLKVTSGRVEVCARPNPSDQEIALYGVGEDKAGHTLKPTDAPTDASHLAGFQSPFNALTIGELPAPTTRRPTATTSASTTFSNPANAVEIGESPTPLTADATLSATGQTSASINLAGYANPPVPPGSTITSASLRVAHQDDAGVGSLRATVTPATGGPFVFDSAPSPGCGLCLHPGAITTDTIALPGLADPAMLVGLSVRYDASLATGAPGGTERLDGIWLDLAYTPPPTHKPTSAPSVSGFVTPTAAFEIGESSTPSTADAALSPSGLTSASLTLAGYDAVPIPPGSTNISARLKVAHQDETGVGSVRATVTPATGGPFVFDSAAATCPGTGQLCLSPAGIATDDIPLPGFTDPAQLTGLSVTWEANLAGGAAGGNEHLDGIWLDVAYTPPPTRKPTAAADAATTFAPPTAALAIDGTTSNAALAPGGPTSATISLSGYDNPPLPAGSVIDSAVLRVAHGDDAGVGSLHTSVTLGSGGPLLFDSAPAPGCQLCLHTGVSEDRLDLRAAGFTDPAQLAGLSVSFTAALPGGGTAPATEHLDGVWLDVAFGPRTSDAALPGPGGVTSARITLAGFRPTIPTGSVVDSAVLRVAHQEQGNIGSVRATVTPTTGSDIAVASTAGPCQLCLSTSAMHEDRIDLKALGMADPAQFSGMTVRYEATLAPGGAASKALLDGIWVDVTFRTPTTRKPTAATAVVGFTNPDRAFDIAGSPQPPTADAALAAAGPTTASLTLAGFGEPPIPPGSVLDAAVLRVAHQDQDAIGSVTATVTPATGAPLVFGSAPSCLQLCLHPSALAEDRIDLGLTTPGQLAGLTVTYAADLASGGTAGTERLDGIAIDVVFRPPTLRKPSLPVAGPTAFANPDNAAEIDGITADATLATGGTTSASVTLAGYGAPAIPPGSAVDSAVLRVAHQEVGAVGSTTVTLTPAPGTGTPVTFDSGAVPCRLCPHTAGITEDRLDVKVAGLGEAAQLNGLTVTYGATLAAAGGAGTERLDGIWLEVVYRPPTTRRPTATTSAGTTFSNPANAVEIGESPTPLTADATLSATGQTSASINLAGYANPPVPPGSTITSASLRVAHQDDAGVGSLRATVTPATGGPFVFDSAPSPGCGLCLHPGAITTDTIALPGLADPAMLVGLSVRYDASLATGAPGGTERLDGIWLDLAYTPPPTHKPTSAPSVSGFVTPTAAFEIDGATSDAALAPGPTASASLTLAGYDAVPIPPGSTITSARLKVAHQDEAGVGSVKATVTPATVPPAAGGPFVFDSATATCPGTGQLCLSPAGIATDDIPLPGFTDPAQLNGLSVTWDAQADAAAGGTEHLDGIWLDVAYTPPTTRKPTAAADAATIFAPPTAALAIDDTTSDAALAPGGPTTATISLSGYDNPPLPAGSVIDSAVLRVAHGDDANVGSLRTSVALVSGPLPPFDSGPAPGCQLCLHAGVSEDRLDLKAAGFTDPAQLAGLSVSFTASLAGGATAPATEHLDGMELDIVYRPPTIRPLTGCVVAGPYGNPSSCAMVSSDPVAGDTATRFAVEGTVYAPLGPIDLVERGVNDQLLLRGVIARTISLDLVPAAGFGRPTVLVPPESVLFCVPDCSNPRLRAEVEFDHGHAKVRGWSVRR